MRKYIIWIVLGLLVIWVISAYNGLVSGRENVSRAWANVETQYQRRSDLIPNLVATVKGAADFEKSTLTAVIEARAKATSVRVDPDKLTPEKMQEFQQAQGAVSSALSRLLVVAENYPQLKAVQGFLDLQAQIEGTENRITESRRQFNETAQGYNTSIAKFPRNAIAGLFGFTAKPYFEADKGAAKAPEVKF